MNIISFGSKILDDNLKDNSLFSINESLLSIISDKKILEDLFNNYNEFLTLGDISDLNGKLVINLLNEIKYFYNYREVFLLENEYKKIHQKENVKFEKVDSLKIDYKVYEEAIRIVVNKFIRNIKIEDIFIIDLRLDEKYCIKNNKKILLTIDESNIVLQINKHLEIISNIFKKILPGINVSSINSGVYIQDIENRTIELEEDLLVKINSNNFFMIE